MSKAKMKPMKIAGELMWAYTNKINDMTEKYQIDICNLSAEAINAIKEVGGNPLNREDKPEKGYYITAKSNYTIPVVDTSGNEIKTAIGNGSKGHVVVQPYAWSFRGKNGVNFGASKVVVTTLVHYEDGSEEVDSDDEVL